MTVVELIQALVPFKDDDDITVAIAGWSGFHAVVSIESYEGKPVIVIEEETDEEKEVIHD